MKRLHMVFVFLCVALLAVGCDYGLEYIEMEITEYPHRIAYYAGQDNQLDLSGGKIKLRTRDGHEDYFDMIETEFDVYHSVDFDKEGVYVVEIKRANVMNGTTLSKISCKFPVQIIELPTEGK